MKTSAILVSCSDSSSRWAAWMGPRSESTPEPSRTGTPTPPGITMRLFVGWYSREGWSDLALFSIFEPYSTLSIRYIFRSSIKKNRNFDHALARASNTGQSFHFQKPQGTYIFYIFRILPKIKFEIKVCFDTYFFSPKMRITVFDLYKGKIIF